MVLVNSYRNQDVGKLRAAVLAATIPLAEYDTLLEQTLRIANDKLDSEPGLRARDVLDDVSYQVRVESAMYHFARNIWESAATSTTLPEQSIRSIISAILPMYRVRNDWERFTKTIEGGAKVFWCIELEYEVRRLANSQQADIRDVATVLTAMADLNSQPTTQQPSLQQPQQQPQQQSQQQPQQQEEEEVSPESVAVDYETDVGEDMGNAAVTTASRRRTTAAAADSRTKRSLAGQSPQASKRVAKPRQQSTASAGHALPDSSDEEENTRRSVYSPSSSDEADTDAISDRQTWLTPARVLVAVRNVFSQMVPEGTPREQYLQLDPCAAEQHPKHTKAMRCLTKIEDGLACSWQMEDGTPTERVYINPPFNSAESWVKKTLSEMAAGRITGAIMLLPVKVSAQWWRELVQRCTWAVPKEPIHFVKIRPSGKLKEASRPCPIEVCFVCICKETAKEAFNKAFRSAISDVAVCFQPLVRSPSMTRS